MQTELVQLVTPERAQELRDSLMALEWTEGKARTKELTGSIKQNLELIPMNKDVDPKIGTFHQEVLDASQELSQAVMSNGGIVMKALPKKMTAVKFNKYDCERVGGQGQYHRHTDAPYMREVRTDFAITIFLTDPSEYEGGTLNIEQADGTLMKVKGPQGSAFIYECGRPHWVDPVSSGERISAVGWIETQVPDVRHRDIMRDCRALSHDMEARMDYKDPDCEYRKWFVDAGKIHAALFREWGNPT